MNRGSEGLATSTRIVEAAAAVAMVVLCAVLVIPAVRRARLHEDLKRVAEQGKQLRAIIFAANTAAETSRKQSPLWPTNTTVSSTAYFKKFFTKGGPSTNPFPADLLAGPGVPVFTGTNIANFAASNNVWYIARPIQYQTNDYPFLFTRNFSAKDQRAQKLKDISQFSRWEAPFRDKGGVVITFEGKARIIRAGDLGDKGRFEDLFNPGGQTNHVYGPWTAAEWQKRDAQLKVGKKQ